MPKIGSLWFPDAVLDALRDDKLVVFAGAGVSMGSPADLPSFPGLADYIAKGTGRKRGPEESLESFLGGLADSGVAVHVRAAERLTQPGSGPTQLHVDLVRMFGSTDRARVITTNFDQHFQGAWKNVYGSDAEVYRAPALPLGRDIGGIIHLHGCVRRPDGMILTDVDFGRAYLTDGWAPRFLLDVFRHYVVLFVGYSHSDTVMNYLARALPPDASDRRFALTDDQQDWSKWKITPIIFTKHAGDPDPYRELNDGMRLFADRAVRRPTHWQDKLAEIGDRSPPIDDETIGEIEQALRQESTARFFVAAARHPKWPEWLSGRGHLDALFQSGPLGPVDEALAGWLAEHYAIAHASELMAVLADHRSRMHPDLWHALSRRVGLCKDISLQQLRRWLAVLMPQAADQHAPHAIMWLAERADALDQHDLVADLFLLLSRARIDVRRGGPNPLVDYLEVAEADGPAGDEEAASKAADASRAEESEHERHSDVAHVRFTTEAKFTSDHHTLNEVWAKFVAPRLSRVVYVLLNALPRQLEELRRTSQLWRDSDDDWDSLSYGRSAIEPHEQDEYPEPIDVLIDAIRDSLAWIAENQPSSLTGWLDQLIVSDAPLLRRLAINALIADASRDGDERMLWLLQHVNLFAHHEHHELFRAVGNLYPMVGEETRGRVVDAVLAHSSDGGDGQSDEAAMWAKFDWLAWLERAAPDCEKLKRAIAPIRAAHPNWELSEHPDLSHWSGAGWVGVRSPFSQEQLLERPAADRLGDMLTFSGSGKFDEPDRAGLLSIVRDACKANPTWAIGLLSSLTAIGNWQTDLWSPLLGGLADAVLTADEWALLEPAIARSDLQSRNSQEIARLLLNLVKDDGRDFYLSVASNADQIAWALWLSIADHREEEDPADWLSRAINRPAGDLVLYWLHGLSRKLNEDSGKARTLPADYQVWFENALRNANAAGDQARAVLSSQIRFLHSLDTEWACTNLVPLFSENDSRRFRQAWDGFLAWGSLNRGLATDMMPGFISAIRRRSELADHRSRFVEFYAALVVFHSEDPTSDLLPEFFARSNESDRATFAHQVGRFLGTMATGTRSELWRKWLRRYWQSRLQAVPVALDPREIGAMLGWLSHLDADYPEAVELAISAPVVDLQNSFFMHRFESSDLVQRFPEATARLLMYLSRLLRDYERHELSKLANQLPVFEERLQRELQDALAEAGINWVPRR